MFFDCNNYFVGDAKSLISIKGEILEKTTRCMSNQLYCEVCHKLKFPRNAKQSKCECNN